MKRTINILQSLDWVTILLYVILVWLGWLNIYAAGYSDGVNESFFSMNYGKQIIWIGLAYLLAILVIVIDSKFYSLFAYPVFGLFILFLIMVVLIGPKVNGARSWIDFGFMKFQPSEFVKFATVLALSKYLSSYNKKIHQFKNILFYLAIIFIPAILILAQPDMGTATVFGALLLVLYREGLHPLVLISIVLLAALGVLGIKFGAFFVLIGSVLLIWLVQLFWTKQLMKGIVGLILMALPTGIFYIVFKNIDLAFFITVILFTLVGLGFSIWKKQKKYILLLAFLLGMTLFSRVVMFTYENVLDGYQQDRIANILGVKQDNRGAGWNLWQSKLAIGSGGISGKGFLKGTHTKLDYVPEQSTDFIFCTIGEEWGFTGALVMFLLFSLLLLRILKLAERQRSSFTRIYGYGVASILFYHIAINVAMTIGLFPVVGIPLPFFSYGGSSLWGFTILLFVFIRLDASRLEFLS